jgi:hypothetical protein
MKNLICVFILIFFGQNSLLQKVTNDLSKQSPFLFVHLKQFNHKSSDLYCIKNDDLFRLLYSDSNISTKRYSSFAFETISKQKNIDLKKKHYQTLRKYRFEKNNRIINTLNKKGVEQIKQLYFRGSILTRGLDDLLKQQIIYSLFLKGVFIYIDDESGEYMIY